MKRLNDIEFKSTKHVLQEIENMNVKGGSPFGRAAAWAFKLACEQEKFTNIEDIKERMESIKKQLNEYKPTMATINNVSKLVLDYIKNNQNELEIKEIQNNIIVLCDNIIENSYKAVDHLALYGANRIDNDDVIMMHSYSSTLMEIFIQAAESGKKFTVICTESRPLRESLNAIKILQGLKIPVKLITDASVYEFLPKCDYVIMGADSIDVDGSVANKMGTSQIAKLAKSCKKEVYIATELFKLDLRTQEGYKIVLEKRTPYEVISDDDLETLDGLEVINQFFDITPANDIKSIICEYGIIHPSQILQYWDRLETDLINWY